MATLNAESKQPVVVELSNALTPRGVLRQFADAKHCLLLESSLRHPTLGRYSYFAANPVEVVSGSDVDPDPLQPIQTTLDRFATPTLAGLPPFQGGWAGSFSYELGRSFETLPSVPSGMVTIPKMTLALYDVVIAWDHLAERVWLISQGLPAANVENERRLRAEVRAKWFLSQLERAVPKRLEFPLRQLGRLPPMFKNLGDGLWGNFQKHEYLSAVQTAVDYICQGDIFQTNLSQQIMFPSSGHPIELFERLVRLNPSTFSGYFDLGDCQIISSSPERLLQIDGDHVETRPIKGTRRRTKKPMVDIPTQQELLANAKERAENTMIVDLMRNDLSKFCEDDSVLVDQWCQIETYETVFHLVSAISGRMRQGTRIIDAVRAVFPGGSVTGAPKIRAMEIISELEGLTRGAYCGSLGYLGLNGTVDLNILIRTITEQHGWWQIPVGGAVVSQSDPEQEYEETWTKAAALLNACRSGERTPACSSNA